MELVRRPWEKWWEKTENPKLFLRGEAQVNHPSRLAIIKLASRLDLYLMLAALHVWITLVLKLWG